MTLCQAQCLPQAVWSGETFLPIFTMRGKTNKDAQKNILVLNFQRAGGRIQLGCSEAPATDFFLTVKISRIYLKETWFESGEIADALDNLSCKYIWTWIQIPVAPHAKITIWEALQSTICSTTIFNCVDNIIFNTAVSWQDECKNCIKGCDL